MKQESEIPTEVNTSYRYSSTARIWSIAYVIFQMLLIYFRK